MLKNCINMQKLKANEIIHVSETVLRVLTQNHITTVVDFLHENVNKLSMITKLSLPQILAAKSEIFHRYSAPLQNGTSLLHRESNFNTGIVNLDTTLEGGLPMAAITELCGLAGCGKTQLCFQIALNSLRNNQNSVLYIDTKGDFSAVRLQKILAARGCSHKEMADIMFRIKVVHVWTMEEIIELLQCLKNESISINNLKLIIIDSLPCLMFQFLGDDNKIGLSLLNTLVNYCRYLCREKGICIICVNIQTRWVDQDMADVEDDGNISYTNKDLVVERRNRCLGKYWQQIPSLVLSLDKIQSNNSGDDIVLSVITSHSPDIESRKCNLSLCDLGVI